MQDLVTTPTPPSLHARKRLRLFALAGALVAVLGVWLVVSSVLRGEDQQLARGVEVPFYDADGKVRWVAKARVAERIGGMGSDSADAGALRFTRVRLLLPRRIDGRDSLLALVADGGAYNAGEETLLLDGNVRGAVYPEARVSFATPEDYAGAPEQYLPPGADLSFSAEALTIRWVYDQPIDGDAEAATPEQPKGVPETALLGTPRGGGRPVLESDTAIEMRYRSRGYHLEGTGMRAFEPPGTLTILADARGTIADARVLMLQDRSADTDLVAGSAMQPWVLAFSTEGPAMLETDDPDGARAHGDGVTMPSGSSIRAITLRRSVRLTQLPSNESLHADEVDINLRMVEAAIGMGDTDTLPGAGSEQLTTRRLELERFEARGRVRLTLPDALDLSGSRLTWTNSTDVTGTSRQDCHVTGLNRCRLWMDPGRDPLSLLGGETDAASGLANVTDSDGGGFIVLSTSEGLLHLSRDIYAAPNARSVVGVETWVLGRGARVERYVPHPAIAPAARATGLPESAAYYLYGMMDASEGATIVQDLREVRPDPLDSVGTTGSTTVRDLSGFDVKRTGTRALLEVYTPDRIRLVTVHGERLVHRRETLPVASDGATPTSLNLPTGARQIWHSILAGPRPQVTWLSNADWRLGPGGAQPSPGTLFRYALMGKGALTMVDFADLDGNILSRTLAQRDDVLYRKSVLSDDRELQDDARLLLRCEAFGLRFGLGPARTMEPVGFRASNVSAFSAGRGAELSAMLRDPECDLVELARNTSTDLSREVPVGSRDEHVVTATVGRDRFRTPEVYWLRTRRPATVSPTAPLAVSVWDDVLTLAGPFDASAESSEIRELVPLWTPSGERVVPARVTLAADTRISLHTVWERLGVESQWTVREIELDGLVRLQAFGPDPGPPPTFDPELLMQSTCSSLTLRWERPFDATIALPPSTGPMPSQYPERLTYGLATGPVRHEDNVRGLTATGDRLTLTWTAPAAESARPRDPADVTPSESVLALPGQRLVLEGSPRVEVRNIYTENLSITEHQEAEPRIGVLTFDTVPPDELEAAGLSAAGEPGRIELYGDTLSARIVPNGRIAWVSMPQREPEEQPFNLLDALRGRTEQTEPEIREDEIDRLTLSGREIFILLAEVENRFELVGLEAIDEVQISEGERQGRGDYLRWTEAGGRRAMLTGDIPVFRERRGEAEVFRLEGVQQYEYAEQDADHPGRRHIITGRARQPGSQTGDRIRLTIDVPGLPGSPSELLRTAPDDGPRAPEPPDSDDDG